MKFTVNTSLLFLYTMLVGGIGGMPCELVDDVPQIEIAMESTGAVQRNVEGKGGEDNEGDELLLPVRETRKFDAESLIRASAAAYQMQAVEEEVGFRHQALNQPTEPTMIEEFSASSPPALVLVEVSDDTGDDDIGSDDDIDSKSSQSSHQNTSAFEEKRLVFCLSRSSVSNKSTESSICLNANEIYYDIEHHHRGYDPSQRIRIKEANDDLSLAQQERTAVSFGFFDIDLEVLTQFLRWTYIVYMILDVDHFRLLQIPLFVCW